jgi:hypothetical protein
MLKVVEDSAIIPLARRIKVLIEVSGLTRVEIHETIMSTRNAPKEDDFRLAYAAALMLPNPSPNGEKTPAVSCTSCDDKGCGFCVTGDSLAAHYPTD